MAMAHANYVKSSPASDARLVRSPSEVRVTFSETPDPKGSDIAVLDTSGARRDGDDVATATDEQNTLRVSVPVLPEGGYLVAWTARSSVDGHETKGAFAFAIGNAPLPSIPDVGPATAPPAPLELAGRALSFAGIAIVLGMGFFALFIRAPDEPRARRRERALVLGGGALLIAGSAVLLVAYGADIPARLLLFVALRALAGAVAIAAVLAPSRLLPAGTRREVIAFAGLAAALWATLVSHAAANGDPRYIALDLIHVVAISVWSGGVVALLLVAIPAVTDVRALGATVWRFSLTALVAVAVIVATGVVQSLDRLVLMEDLV
ncbi:MAG TPA: copper resistance protein CopC, partial [Candidatus Limnocylindria bacterium]|nr:copper resistance protein CopC [Candidatus Limnocylindria bacterium]